MPFYVLVPQKASAGDCQCHEYKIFVSLCHVTSVPLLFLKEWRNGKQELQSVKEEPEAQSCEQGT